MKFLLALALFVLAASAAGAQSLSLFGIDTTNFPTMKAKFYAFDAAGNQVRPTAGELILTENGIARTITSVSCPPPAPPVAISSVLTVDVSGSMSSGPAGTRNIDLAKAAARAWIQGLPAGQSECALSSFNDGNYLNQDFTTDRSRLLNSLATLSPNGGTNYDMGLLQPLAGSLQVSQRGQYKRVVVFLSDGMPNFEPNTAAIIAEAKKQNCLIFAVTLGMPCPQLLKEISSQTGGQWYENVTTTPEAEEVYQRIMQLTLGNDPCEITWQSGTTCQGGNVKAELAWNGQKSLAQYTSPSDAVADLSFSPPFIFCRNKPVGISFDTTVTVTANNSAFTVLNITSSNPVFDVNPKQFTLNAGQSQILTVSYTPADSGYVWAKFDVQTDVCPEIFSSSGGFLGKRPAQKTLKLTHPNGGEAFVVGSDTVITWDGIAKSETVELEYSIDNGNTWKSITTTASDLQYIWKNIPKPASNQCKVRVKQNSGSESGMLGIVQFTLGGHTSIVLSVCWSPDGTKVATAGNDDNTAKIWSAVSGAMLLTLSGHTDGVLSVSWSPDGTKVATGSNDNTARIWSAGSGATLLTLSGHTDVVHSVSWSPDGTKVATGSDDKTARIWSAVSGAVLLTLGAHAYGVTSVSWSPDGTKAATGSWDATARIWSAVSGAELLKLSGHTRLVTSVSWSPDGTKVATGSEDRTAKIWSAVSGAVLLTLIGHTSYVTSVSWSPDGMKVATGSYDNTAKIWSAVSGAVLLTLSGHTAYVNSVSWSPDGMKVATGSHDNTAKIWFVDDVLLQEDESDAVFSIVMPQPAAQDIDMGRVLVGSAKDSVVVGVIRNTGSYRFRVDSIAFSGNQAPEFRLVSGFPPFVVQPSDSARVEFRFMPAAVGARQAQMLVFTQADSTLQQTIRGEGVQPELAVVNSVIDFGKVLVGTSRDTLKAVTIRNIGTAPLLITDTKPAGPNTTDFTTLAGGGVFTLNPNEVARLDIRFTPSDAGRIMGRLQFYYNGVGSPAEVTLFGEGYRPDSGKVTLVAGTASAFPGEQTHIPITLELPQNSTLSNVTGFDVTLRYNSTLLFPADNAMTVTSSGNDALLTFFAPYNPAGGELLRVPFIATLGDDTATVVKIEKAVPRVALGKVEVATRNGSFALKGVCYAGGAARLYKPSGRAMLMAIRPNPAEDEAEIEYETSETGATSIKVFNALGMEVSVPASGEMNAGFHVAKVRTSDFGTGTYFVVMTTPTERHVARFEVVR